MEQRVIVSAIIQDGNRVLLGKKAKGKPPYPDVWHLPGGGVEDQEKGYTLVRDGAYDNDYFLSELQREVREETGVAISNVCNIIPQFRSVPREGFNKNKDGNDTHYYFLEYLCDYQAGEAVPGDDIAELAWIEKETLAHVNVTEPSVEMYKELGWLT